MVRRLAAVLAADVVGYSRMMGEDEARTLAGLRRLREAVIAPEVAAHRGNIVKSLGDGWLVAFDSAAEAVRCALAVQDALAQQDAQPGDALMLLRVGGHIGDVGHEDGYIYGDGVNIAARLEAVAAPGGIAISDAARSSLDGTLRSEFEDAGLHDLKNIASSVRVWVRGGEATTGHDVPAPRAGTAVATSFPSIAVAPFETPGRDPDHAALAEGIADDVATELSRFRWLHVVDHEGEQPARYLLSGAVRGAGRRVRVSASLTFGAESRRLWSERWDRDSEDIFAVQDELVPVIVARVCPEIDDHDKTMIRARPAESLSAYELSLRANQLLATGKIEAFEEAEHLMARATALEPGDPQAWVQKAMVNYLKALSGAWPMREKATEALETVRKGIALDSRRANGFGMLAAILAVLGETDRALDAADRVEDLNPNAWGAPHGRAIAYAFARPEWVADPRAHGAVLLANAERTLQMAPATAYRSGHLFFVGLGILMRDEAGDLDEAITALDRAASEPGASWWPGLFMALAELRRGRDDAARECIDEARTVLPALSVAIVQSVIGASWIASHWQAELARLPELGLPVD